MSISSELKKQAIGLGLCAQWQGEWGDPTNAQLIDKYIRGIDFAIAHNWPSVEYIKSHFDKALLHEKGVWCDEEVGVPKRKIMVLNGQCSGKLVFDDFDVAAVYVRHASNVTIEVRNFARVSVSVFDGANAHVVGKSASTAIVYPYGDKSVCVSDGNVRVRARRDFSEL